MVFKTFIANLVDQKKSAVGISSCEIRVSQISMHGGTLEVCDEIVWKPEQCLCYIVSFLQ
jgi:hypothetical protein